MDRRSVLAGVLAGIITAPTLSARAAADSGVTQGSPGRRPTPPVPRLYPPDRFLGHEPIPFMGRPGYLTPVTDPTYGTRITRIADHTVFGTTRKPLRHSYARVQPWNADGSRIWLGSPYPAPYLRGSDYSLIEVATGAPAEARWSNTDPDIMYGIQYQSARLVTWNYVTKVNTLLREFTEYDTVRIGFGEGNLSNDDRYIALQGVKAGVNSIFLYDIKTDTVVGTLTTGSVRANNVSVSQLGRAVVVVWGVNGTGPMQGVDVYSKDMTWRRKLTEFGGSHCDLGINTDGHEVLVTLQWTDWKGSPVAHRLVDGKMTDLLGTSVPRTSSLYWANYYHVSCRNIQRPGWAYFSSYHGYDTGDRYGVDQVYALKLDGSGTVEVFAHSHHKYSTSYPAQPHAVPNPWGDQVMFASDWGVPTSTGEIYAYVAQQV